MVTSCGPSRVIIYWDVVVVKTGWSGLEVGTILWTQSKKSNSMTKLQGSVGLDNYCKWGPWQTVHFTQKCHWNERQKVGSLLGWSEAGRAALTGLSCEQKLLGDENTRGTPCYCQHQWAFQDSGTYCVAGPVVDTRSQTITISSLPWSPARSCIQ